MRQFLKVFIVSLVGVLLVAKFTYAQNISTAEEWVKKGWEYADRGEREKAKEAFNKAIELDPNNAEAYIGSAYFAPTAKVMEIVMKAILLDPDNPKILSHALTIHGGLLLMQLQFDKAAEDLNKAIELDPNNARAYYIRGGLYAATGKHQLAELDFSKACRMGYINACKTLENLRRK